MADCYSQTVIQQTIPEKDMTPLERLILSQVFTVERREDGSSYLYADERPADFVTLDREDLIEAFGQSRTIAHGAALIAYVAGSLSQAPRNATKIELDLSGMSWELIFQGIVRRSSTLRYVTVVAAFTCTKMRADGFGGMATLITKDRIFGKSTSDLLQEFRAEAGIADD